MPTQRQYAPTYSQYPSYQYPPYPYMPQMRSFPQPRAAEDSKSKTGYTTEEINTMMNRQPQRGIPPEVQRMQQMRMQQMQMQQMQMQQGYYPYPQQFQQMAAYRNMSPPERGQPGQSHRGALGQGHMRPPGPGHM